MIAKDFGSVVLSEWGPPGLFEEELCGLLGDLFDVGDDLAQAASVGDPVLVEGDLLVGDPRVMVLPATARAPLPVGSVELGGVGLAAAAGIAAGGVALDQAAGGDEADVGELGGEPLELGLVAGQALGV